jgi:hypothetical protein
MIDTGKIVHVRSSINCDTINCDTPRAASPKIIGIIEWYLSQNFMPWCPSWRRGINILCSYKLTRSNARASFLSIPNNKENKVSCWSVYYCPWFFSKITALPPLSQIKTKRFIQFTREASRIVSFPSSPPCPVFLSLIPLRLRHNYSRKPTLAFLSRVRFELKLFMLHHVFIHVLSPSWSTRSIASRERTDY